MKRLHRDDLYCWSRFDERRDLDFHSVFWHRAHGNIVIDPLPLGEHDVAQLRDFGGAKWIVITNSDHIRDAAALAELTGAGVMGPRGESATFPLHCEHWLADEVEVVPGLEAFELEGSKTPGELALLLEETTLITGDLVRCERGGRLSLLPDDKLASRADAVRSVRQLSFLPKVETVIVGDGWPVFSGGGAALKELVEELSA